MKLEIQNGSFRYPSKDHETLHEINLTVEDGNMIAVLGPNGSGKTTLLRCAVGFLHWHSGQTLLNGTDIRKIPPKLLWQQIGYVPQARHSISPYTVEETVLLGRNAYFPLFGGAAEKDRKKVAELLEQLGLTPIRHAKCSEISGGELQMTLIARALAAEPKLLVLDEPESNLDFKNQLVVLDTLSALARKGVACIFNTHYPAHALRRADKCLLLAKDRSYLFGTTAETVTEENLARFFGVNTLIGTLQKDGISYPDVIPISLDERM